MGEIPAAPTESGDSGVPATPDDAAPAAALPDMAPKPPRRRWPWLIAGVAILLAVLAGCAVAFRAWTLNKQQAERRATEAWQAQATQAALQAALQAVQAALQAGQTGLQAGSWAAAETAFDQVLAMQPPPDRQTVLEATLGRGLARYHLGQYPAALEDFASVQVLDPARPEPYHYRTEIIWAQGDLNAAVAAGQEALKHEPGYALPYALQALQAYQRHDNSGALAAAGASIQRDPTLALAYRIQGSVQAWQYNFDPAWDSLSKAITQSPGDVDARAMRVYVALWRQDEKSAVSDAAQVAQAAPQAPAALWAEAQVKLYHYDPESAQALINKAIGLDATRPEFYIVQGRTYTLTVDAPRALASYQKALALQPDFVPAVSSVAFWHLNQWDTSTDQADGQHLLALNPSAPDGYLLLAAYNQRTHHNAEALKYLQQVLEMYPQVSYVYLGRGSYYLDQRDYVSAQADYEHALALDPLSLRALGGLATIALRQKKYDAANGFLEQALKVYPSSRNALALQALTRSLQGTRAEAWTIIRVAAALDSQDPYVLVTRAVLSTADADYSNALADLGRVLQAYPGYAYAYAVRARAYLAEGNPQQAVLDGQRILDLDHDSPDGYLVLALAAAQQKDWAGAITQANKVVELDPKSPDAFLVRGRANLERGNPSDAIADLQKSVALDPAQFNAYADLATAQYETGDIAGAIDSAQAALARTKDLNQINSIENDLVFYKSIPPLIGNQRTVNDQAIGYSLTYPQAWRQLQLSANQTTVLWLVPTGGPSQVNFQLVLAGPSQNLTVQDWAASLDKAESGASPSYRSLSLSPAKIGKLNGLVRTYRYTAQIGGDAVTITGRQYYVLAQRKTWVIDFQAPSALYSQYSSAADDMVASVSVS